MAEYIERETARAQLIINDELHAADLIKSIHAADVRPVVRSSWERVEVKRLDDMDEETRVTFAVASMFCPNCKRYHNEVYFYGIPTENVKFCSNCGAEMEGKT